MLLILQSIVLGFCLFFTNIATAEYTLNMPYGVTPISQDIYDLHMAAFYVCCVIGLFVFVGTIYSLVKFRKSKGAVAHTFHQNLTIEIIWTIIPFIILVCLAIPATRVLGNIHNTEESKLSIKVTGYQWKWEYEYLDSGIKFFSFLSTPYEQINNQSPKGKWFLIEVDRPLVVPINTKVKLLITSDDVVHSWWIPDLGVKQDAVPGFINENWIYVTKPGEYRGQCGELCGVNHGFMPIVVKAVTEVEFAAWVKAEQQAALTSATSNEVMTMQELMTLGKQEYTRNCAMCHQENGKGLTSDFPPLVQSRVILSPLPETIAYILHGVPGTPMQAFGNILDNKTLAAIITYIRNTWGNDVPIKNAQYSLIAQPADIEKMRESMNMTR